MSQFRTNSIEARSVWLKTSPTVAMGKAECLRYLSTMPKVGLAFDFSIGHRKFEVESCRIFGPVVRLRVRDDFVTGVPVALLSAAHFRG